MDFYEMLKVSLSESMGVMAAQTFVDYLRQQDDELRNLNIAIKELQGGKNDKTL